MQMQMQTQTPSPLHAGGARRALRAQRARRLRQVTVLAAVGVVATVTVVGAGLATGGSAPERSVTVGGTPPPTPGTVTGTVTAPVVAGGTATVPVTCATSARRYEATFAGADLGGATVGVTVSVEPFKGPGTWSGTGTLTVAGAGGVLVTAPFIAPVTVGADSAAQVSISTAVGGTPVSLTLAWSCTSVWPSY
ncbi:MAG: hypothetical protein ACKOVH_01945 [Actinomycetota bacterium]